MSKFTYLFINFITIFFPLIMSFEKKIFFFSKWKFVFASMLVVGTFFLFWDSFFTYLGVWGFNPDYITEIYVYNLPLEEILFFVTVPFACMFIYECVHFYLKEKLIYFKSNYINIFAIILLICTGCYYTKYWYTALACIGAGIYLTYHLTVTKSNFLAQFWVTFLIILVPFFVVNSVLTGLFTDAPIVWYNNSHNLGLRLGTIPIEDLAYNLLLVLMSITFYERFKNLKSE